MWNFVITADGFRVFEVLPNCVKISGAFRAMSLKESLDGVLSHVRHAYDGMEVNVYIDDATFDMHGNMVGMVRVVML